MRSSGMEQVVTAEDVFFWIAQKGAGLQRAGRVDFEPRVRLEFRGTQLSSDGGLLVKRELDEVLGLSSLASAGLRDIRSGLHTIHWLEGLFRQ